MTARDPIVNSSSPPTDDELARKLAAVPELDLDRDDALPIVEAVLGTDPIRPDSYRRQLGRRLDQAALRRESE